MTDEKIEVIKRNLEKKLSASQSRNFSKVIDSNLDAIIEREIDLSSDEENENNIEQQQEQQRKQQQQQYEKNPDDIHIRLEGFENQNVFRKILEWLKEKNEKRKSSFFVKILKLLVGRITLIVICGLAITFNICIYQNWLSLIYLAPVSIIFFETLYICFMKRGSDFKFFSLSAFAYLMIMISIIWDYTLYRVEKNDLACHNETRNEQEKILIHKCFGVNIKL